jgi:hypothetical protein
LQNQFNPALGLFQRDFDGVARVEKFTLAGNKGGHPRVRRVSRNLHVELTVKIGLDGLRLPSTA